MPRPLTLALVSAFALALGTPALAAEPPVPPVPPDWSLTTGLRLGSNHTEISGLESDSFHIGPMVDLRYKDFTLGFAFLWAEFNPPGIALDVPLPAELTAIGAPAFFDLPETKSPKVDRFDFDVSLKYKLHAYVTPFIGYRLERFPDIGFEVGFDDPQIRRQIGEIAGSINDAVANGLLTQEQAQQLAAGLVINPQDFQFTLDLQYFAVGSVFQYPIHEWNLVPFVIGTGFPYVIVEGDDDTWAGFAVEGGLAYLLGRHFDLPLYVTATVKFQKIDADATISTFDDVFPGISELFPAEEEFINTNVALFYQFDL